MIVYKHVKTSKREIEKVICDRCKKDLTKDVLERQEMMNYRNVGGYSAVFGDGMNIELDMCQHCVKEVLGAWIRVSKFQQF